MWLLLINGFMRKITRKLIICATMKINVLENAGFDVILFAVAICANIVNL